MKELIYKYRVAIVLFFILVFISLGGGSVVYIKYLKGKLKESETIVKQAEKNIKEYKPKENYLKQIDSLKKELEHLKTFSNEKVRYVYINSNFDDKYKLLSDRIKETKVSE